MKIPDRPKSIVARLSVLALGLWVSAAICFVLFNRYRNGSEWDSVTDLLLLAFFLPLSLVALGIASWAAGRRALMVALSLLIVGSAIGAGWSTYQAYVGRQSAQAAEERQAVHRKQLEAQFGSRCASEKSSTNGRTIDPYGIDAYEYCLFAEEQAAGERKQ